MKETAISACYVSPLLSTEQFVPNHCFVYLISGPMLPYDGIKEYKIKAGDYGIARRSHLAKYIRKSDNKEIATMLGEHLSKKKGKKILLVILGITLALIVAGIVLLSTNNL